MNKIKTEKLNIDNIPAILWGRPSDKVYIFVHGKMSCKESAEEFAEIAEKKGFQTISFDLPEHGERKGENQKCDIWNGTHDLIVIGDYTFSHWKEVSLSACSLGAYFSLNAYSDRTFKNCLFQSPILDMEYLTGQMMIWFHVSKEQLRLEKEVPTPIDTLSWDYYQYVREHPIKKWNIPISILYGGKDNLQSLTVIETFVKKYDCKLTVAKNSEHPFMTKEDREIVRRFMIENI